MLLRCGWKVGSSCYKQCLDVHPCMLGHWPMRLYSTTRAEVKQKKGFIERRNENAQKWLNNLSPEMEKRRKSVEADVQILQDQGLLGEYEIQPADMKHLMKDRMSISSIEQYLIYRIQTEQSNLARKESRKKILEEKVRKEAGILDPDVFEVFPYTEFDYKQSSRFFSNRVICSSLEDCIPVVFDMDFEMNMREEVSTVSQIEKIFSTNKRFSEPCPLHFTSYMKNATLIERLECGILPTEGAEFFEESLIERYPREKLVYLSPAGPELKHHIPGNIYIIGGLNELNIDKDCTLKKAKRLGIRCGSFPFKTHGIDGFQLKGNRGNTLTLIMAFEFVLNINLKHKWEYVINDFSREHNIQPIKSNEGFL